MSFSSKSGIVLLLLKKLFGIPHSRFDREVSFIITGIGNKGQKYLNTRHNIGFLVVDALLKKCEETVRERRCRSEIVTCRIPLGEKVAIVKPQTFVNRSGKAIKEIIKLYNQPLSSWLIVVDDFNLPLGRFRFRRDGTDGGHKGLRSIISEIGTAFPRLRIGTGPLPEDTSVIDFVLSNFNKHEIDKKNEIVDKAADAVLFFCKNGIEAAMNTFNKSS